MLPVRVRVCADTRQEEGEDALIHVPKAVFSILGALWKLTQSITLLP